MKVLVKKWARMRTFLLLSIVLLIAYSALITFLYLGKHSMSSYDYSQQEKEIIAQRSSDKLSVKVSNQIDNYVAIEEHSLPVGGGGWCVLKKESDAWELLFCSSDEVYCSLYDEYRLPKGLIGECVNFSDFIK